MFASLSRSAVIASAPLHLVTTHEVLKGKIPYLQDYLIPQVVLQVKFNHLHQQVLYPVYFDATRFAYFEASVMFFVLKLLLFSLKLVVCFEASPHH